MKSENVLFTLYINCEVKHTVLPLYIKQLHVAHRPQFGHLWYRGTGLQLFHTATIFQERAREIKNRPADMWSWGQLYLTVAAYLDVIPYQ